MKKLFSIFLFIMLLQSIRAQVVFCPPGAEWHYSFRVEAFANAPWLKWVNEQIKYDRDTVIDNTPVKVLQHRRLYKKDDTFGGTGTFIKQNGDTVFFRNRTTSDQWQILYNYAALPGQSWQNRITVNPVFWPDTPTAPHTSTYTVIVDSVKNIVVNSFNLRRLYVRYTGIVYNGLTIIMNTDTACIDERFGCSQFLFNFYNKKYASDYREYFNGFLCYADNTFGTKQFTEKSCNYTDAVGIKETSYKDHKIKIYPNPVSDFFIIESGYELSTAESTMSIQNLFGREIKRITNNSLNDVSHKVDVSDLPEGLYFLSVLNNNTVIYTGKLFKGE